MPQSVVTTSAHRSYSVDSFAPVDSQEQRRDQYEIFVDENQPEQRPVQTQSVEVGIDNSIATPVAFSNSQSEGLDSSQHIHQHISPILHIKQVDGSYADTSQETSSPSKTKSGNVKASQKSIAYHLGTKKAMKQAAQIRNN